MTTTNVLAVKKIGNKLAVKAQVMYAHVQNPNTTFDPAGVYSVDVYVSEEQKDQWSEFTQPILDAFYNEQCKSDPKLKKLAKVGDVAAEMYNDDGDVIGYRIRAKQKAIVQTRGGDEINFSIKVTDAYGKPIPEDVLIGNGSVCVVLLEPAPFYSAKDKEMGLSYRLKEIRVLDLVEYAGASALDELDDEFLSVDGGSAYKAEEVVKEDDVPFKDEDELY